MEEPIKEEKGLEISSLITVFLAISILLILIIPKIYIGSNIYYKSLEIEREKSKLLVLEDEKRELSRQLELYKFKNGID